jgi:hypothetical protein
VLGGALAAVLRSCIEHSGPHVSSAPRKEFVRRNTPAKPTWSGDDCLSMMSASVSPVAPSDPAASEVVARRTGVSGGSGDGDSCWLGCERMVIVLILIAVVG